MALTTSIVTIIVILLLWLDKTSIFEMNFIDCSFILSHVAIVPAFERYKEACLNDVWV